MLLVVLKRVDDRATELEKTLNLIEEQYERKMSGWKVVEEDLVDLGEGEDSGGSGTTKVCSSYDYSINKLYKVLGPPRRSIG